MHKRIWLFVVCCGFGSACTAAQKTGSAGLAGANGDTANGEGRGSADDSNNDQNTAPTAIALSQTRVRENSAYGTALGTLTAVDDSEEGLRFELLDSADGRFSLDNTTVRVASAALDFEAQALWTLSVRVTDSGGLSFDTQIPVTIVDVNEPPTAVGISNASIAENTTGATVVGTLSSSDPEAADTHSHTLIDGAGRFALNGDALIVSGALDFEAQAQWTVTVRTMDSGGLTFDAQIPITLVNVNERPTGVTLSSTTVAENAALATVVGTLSSVDPDQADTAIYSLVDGAGVFALTGNTLVVSGALDFEAQAQRTVTLRVTDSGGLSFDAQIPISILNINEAPTAITLSHAVIDENSDLNAAVGTLSSLDPDVADTHTYSLIDDAGVFAISGNMLVVDGALDFEELAQHTITVRSTDSASNIRDEQLSIHVNDVAEVTSLADAGPGTLRDLAGAAATGARIQFAVAGTIALQSQIILNKDVSIENKQANPVTLSGGGLVRIFDIRPAVTVDLRNLDIANGGGLGGSAILSWGTLSLSRSTIRDSRPVDESSSAGGVLNYGNMVIDESTISGNRGYYGGGLYNATGGSLRVTRSTISANSTSRMGAGVYNNGTALFINSTISGNYLSMGNNGVGAAVANVAGTLTLVFSTVSNNSASASDGVQPLSGSCGGIYNTLSSYLTLLGSIVAANTAATYAPDLASPGFLFSLGYNVIGDKDTTNLQDGVNNDRVGTTAAPLDPLLDPLADYGGPTFTMRPQAASPAVDTIPLASCVDAQSVAITLDQRGIERAQNMLCDVGAVER